MSNKKIFLYLFAFFITTIAFAEPKNLDSLKTQLKQYHDSGKYYQVMDNVDNKAIRYLSARIKENQKSAHPKNLAIVLDIDETSLSNYQDMLGEDFGGSADMINNDIAKADDTAIPGTLALFNFAKANDVSIFFITGRIEKLRHATTKNLKQVGYSGWTALYLRPNIYPYTSIIPFKSTMRKRIEESGYDIVLNVGDQFSDLNGGYADKTYKLPDPYYYLP